MDTATAMDGKENKYDPPALELRFLPMILSPSFYTFVVIALGVEDADQRGFVQVSEVRTKRGGEGDEGWRGLHVGSPHCFRVSPCLAWDMHF
ncbi:hypothetical protein AMTR_s00010p00221320 [Amborella trichopoda]|uniref:Uncharacterized protein n=1 Tax=Amborella trichopoda TaxID=13333 RepID=W1NFL0_AMBTC|nr:hypothetical protein AMTR_s00010p00221320 [Amborella trichopoda]